MHLTLIMPDAQARRVLLAGLQEGSEIAKRNEVSAKRGEARSAKEKGTVSEERSETAAERKIEAKGTPSLGEARPSKGSGFSVPKEPLSKTRRKKLSAEGVALLERFRTTALSFAGRKRCTQADLKQIDIARSYLLDEQNGVVISWTKLLSESRPTAH